MCILTKVEMSSIRLWNDRSWYVINNVETSLGNVYNVYNVFAMLLGILGGLPLGYTM